MTCKLFVFRHAETTDNAQSLFSGWRDPRLTSKGVTQARAVAEQLRDEETHHGFTSHLQRARGTLAIVLEAHPDVPVYVDDRLIERCYGLLQGKSKQRVARERPRWYAKIHRAYDFPPPEGESLKMVAHRTLPFITKLRDWLRHHPGNVAISCHGNLIRPFLRVFEHLSLKQMLQLENPQDEAIEYALHLHKANLPPADSRRTPRWQDVRVPVRVKLATDPRNPLQPYYASHPDKT